MLPLPPLDPAVSVLEIVPRSSARGQFAVQPRPAATPLEEDALLSFNRGRTRAGLAPAALEPLLSEVAEAYARLLLRESKEVAAAAVEPLCDWVGLVDVYPTFHARETVGGGDGGFLRFVEELGQHGAGRVEEEEEPGWQLLGVGRCLEQGRWIHVLAVVRRLLELQPCARHPPPGAVVTFTGRLAVGVSDPQAFLLLPGRSVQTLPTTVHPGGLLSLTWEMPAVPAWALLEVAATTRLGPRVVARCALSSTPLAGESRLRLLLPPDDDAGLEPAAASSRLLDLVNRARRFEGAPPLEPDRLAAAVAAGFAQELLREGTTGHLSAGQQDPGQRFQTAGLAVTRLAECVARDRSVTAAFLALIQSLAHRNVLLDPRFCGAGVAARPAPGAASAEWIVVLDLFRPLVRPTGPEAAGELAREIARLREDAGVAPLTADAGLRTAARELAGLLLHPASHEEGWLQEQLAARLDRLEPPVLEAWAVVRGATDPLSVAGSDPELVAEAWTHLGIGLKELPALDGVPQTGVVVLVARRFGN
ncbi:MAG: hypothetical protein RBU45_10470 [Myxococcota bacterium]|jgi:uncharacterized protein YkwD|nr:hypothetical protein [Myxococcota bacterium]